MISALLQLEGISKKFGSTEAVAGINLRVEPGTLLALLGPSGCGKTTLLRLIAGFTAPTAGRVELGGHDITTSPPNKRNIGIVFQNYALFPHMSVADNVAFGLKVRRLPAESIKKRVEEVLALVQLTNLADRYPGQLSGGQQQRAAVARALAIDPALLLLDEPLSALDKNLRHDVQQELRHLQKSVGVTCIVVTHDQEEAFSLADEIAVMQGGRIVQRGKPQELYDQPSTRFVANFLGTGNFIRGFVVTNDIGSFSISLGTPSSAGPDVRVDCPTGVAPGSQIELFFRPERVRIHPAGHSSPAGGTDLAARVTNIRPMGARFEIECESANQRFFCHLSPHDFWPGLTTGQEVIARIPPGHLRCLDRP